MITAKSREIFGRHKKYLLHQTLAELIVSRTDKLIPVEKIGFFELSNQTGRVRIIASKGWELLKGRSIRFRI